jgi:hypothetical protein
MRLRAEAYSVAEICAVVGLARSTFYHAAEEGETNALRQGLLDLAGQHPTSGLDGQSQAHPAADAADEFAASGEKAQKAYHQQPA